MSMLLNSHILAPAGGGGDFDESDMFVRLRADSFGGLSNGDSISTNWEDMTANSYDFAPTNTPTWRSADGPNSTPCVRFAAANSEYFTGPDWSGLGLAEAEVFAVIKVNADPAASSATAGLWTLANGPVSGAGEGLSLYPFTDGNVYDRVFTAGTRTSNNFATTLAQWNLYNVRNNGGLGGYNNYLNGTAGSTPQSNGLYNPPIVYLGRSSIIGLDWYLDGDVAEFFAFSVVTSGAQRTSINDYMLAHYGLTIS